VSRRETGNICKTLDKVFVVLPQKLKLDVSDTWCESDPPWSVKRQKQNPITYEYV